MTDEPIVDHLLLDAARDLRTAAADAYERRAEQLDALAKLVEAGVWQGEAVRAAVAEGRRDRALLRMRVWEFIEAAGGGNDLPLDYRPLLLPGRPPREADLDGAEGFLDKLRPRDADTELWLRALKLEARAYLSQLRGDRALREAERLADRTTKQLLTGVDRLRADDLRRMAAYIMALRVYRSLYLPWRVES
ncbi:MAG: hypothetical protein MUC34_04750, partial [Anaerolineae bacterium]|nr:hypothetical protein [Anaerolineae bacterium]